MLTGFKILIRSFVYISLGEMGEACMWQISELNCRLLSRYPGLPVPGGTDAPHKQRLRSYFRGSILGDFCGGVIGWTTE